MKNQKKFLPTSLIPVVIIVLLIAGGAYFYSKSKNNTTPGGITPYTTNSTSVQKANMKTYTNTKYGYSFNYPSDWEVLGTATDDTIGLAPQGNQDASIKVDVSNMIFDDRGPVSFAEYAKVAARNEIQNYNELSTIKEVTTNSGLMGYETTWKVAPPPGAGRGISVSDPITYFPLSSKYGTGLLSKRIQISAEGNYSNYSNVYQEVIPTLIFSN